jgi:hypothetical protein
MKKGLLLVMLCFLLTSCNKKLMRELEYDSDYNDVLYVYEDKEPFNGEAWSNDKKSFKISVEEGVCTSVEFYNNNGKLMFSASGIDMDRHIYYSNKGRELERRTFKKLYPGQYKLLNDLEDEFSSIISSRNIDRND